MKIYTNEFGNRTSMAAMPIYVKTFKILLLQNHLNDGLETWYVAVGTQVLPYPIPNYVPGLILILFTPRSILVT